MCWCRLPWRMRISFTLFTNTCRRTVTAPSWSSQTRASLFHFLLYLSLFILWPSCYSSESGLPGSCLITVLYPRKRCKVLWVLWCVYLFVCLFAWISLKPHVRALQNFVYMVLMAAVVWFSCNAIHYVLPVLWLTSCFYIMGPMSHCIPELQGDSITAKSALLIPTKFCSTIKTSEY